MKLRSNKKEILNENEKYKIVFNKDGITIEKKTR